MHLNLNSRVLIALGLLLAGQAAQAEYDWQDTFAGKKWPTSAAACLQGEVEARIAEKRRLSPGIQYRYRSVNHNEFIPDSDSRCQYLVERRVSFVWVADIIGDNVHVRAGAADNCPRGATDESGYCQPKDAGEDCKNEGNPINPATSNKTQSEQDYQGSMMVFERTYNALSAETGPFGNNWRHSFQRSLSVSGSDGSNATQVKLYQADGNRFNFTFNGSAWLPDSDIDMRLSRTVDGNGNTSSWQLKLPDDSTETYSPEGRLLTITPA